VAGRTYNRSRVQVSDFNYQLPPELIAQVPLADRAASRVLHLERHSGAIRDLNFRDFPSLLRPDDLVVFNNTRVFPARLLGRRGGIKAQTPSPSNRASRNFLQGHVEVLLTRQISSDPNVWECLVHPGRKIGIGERLYFGDDELQAEVIERGSFGERRIRFQPAADFFASVERLGHVPLPPYIDRPDVPADRERYQTIYARERGSVAAPTAGLHFTETLLEEIRSRGVHVCFLTLHVGLGTFAPVKAEKLEEHVMHEERFELSAAIAETINEAKRTNRRIIAVGTTSLRVLESVAASNQGHLVECRGRTRIFIYPPCSFRVADALLTNFHMPKSTLLALVAAFAGRDRVLAAYATALEHSYRFLSYGDAMWIPERLS